MSDDPIGAPPPFTTPPNDRHAPPPTVAYPRGQVGASPAADRLQALSDAYFSLTWVFVVAAVLVVFFTFNGAMSAQGNAKMDNDPAYRLGYYMGPFMLAGAVAWVMSYKTLQRASFGMGWNPRTPMWLSLVLGLQTCICCGAFGILIVQHILVGEMQKYGIKGRFLGGVRKDQIAAVVAQLRAQGPPPV